MLQEEIDELMKIMKRLIEEGKSIIFITHKLNEIKQVADRVSVLRKGKYIGTVDVAITSKEEMSEMMVGRKVIFEIEKKEVVSNANTNKGVKNISYEDQKKAKSLQNRLSKIESQIQQLEKDIQLDDKALASNYDKHIEDATFFAAYEKKKKELEQLLEDWENVQLEIEELNS